MENNINIQSVFKLKPGDILLTRNADESLNTSPGFWNHTAIAVNASEVVEAMEGKGVIRTPLSSFLDRYAQIVLMRYAGKYDDRAAKFAEQSVGQPYRYISSIFLFLRRQQRGENCVSLVRRAYRYAYSFDFLWQTPDSIYYDKRLELICTLK